MHFYYTPFPLLWQLDCELMIETYPAFVVRGMVYTLLAYTIPISMAVRL